ncbi:hypothetical protein BC939DRAFT_481243 [Gamsiella multidivaricata]|uniref:uncharacterized protein n=1 Tax=Gamsiella multidivaricata TaxID=101098 RepID=UPI00221E61E0|nr:uncharacterized protein BC939DRAFT_481243 [Gamsiella multidivaricata]KAI7817380.1 hypothetical protein BC939DRAFT_481243 [Gamsiella multidivaricata]
MERPRASSETDDSNKGYLMQSDNGRGHLSARQAWDEYHGPVAEAKRQDSTWASTKARNRAYQRRGQLVKLIMARAEKEKQSIEPILDTLTTSYKGRSINFAREQFLASSKE